MKLNEKEFDESELENVHAGIYKKELVDEMAEQNPSLFRQEMIKRLEEEKEKISNEHTKKAM